MSDGVKFIIRVTSEWASRMSTTQVFLLWSEVKWSENCSVVSDSLRLHQLYSPWNSPGQNTGVGSLSLLQGIFPTQESNPGLPHCGQILYQLSHKGSPRIREWVAYPCSRGSSQPRNQTRVSCIAGGFFATELSGKPLLWSSSSSWVSCATHLARLTWVSGNF